jgi:hypothetical protein
MRGTPELTDRLREDVLKVITEYEKAATGPASAAQVLESLLARDWSKTDFRDSREPVVGGFGLYRAVDRALQYHRQAGRIYHDKRGWKLDRQ